GSGKSSLLHAGLAHTVRQQGLAGVKAWHLVSLRPGSQPARSLATALLAEAPLPPDEDAPGPPAYEHWRRTLDALLADAGGGRPLLLLFDQFEELFTLCRDEAQRRAVAEALARAAVGGGDRFRLVLAMRSDYL